MDYPKSVPSVGLVNGKFVDEDVAAGTQGSLIPAAWGNAITQEILSVIEAANQDPDEEDTAQLLAAIELLIANASLPDATEDHAGKAPLASQPEAEAAVNNSKIMTPLRTLQLIVKRIATQAQVLTGTSTTTLVTPANLAQRLQTATPVVGTCRNGRMVIAAQSVNGTFMADELYVQAALGGFGYKLKNINKTINLATVGANGMDVGAAPISGAIAMYVIYNPATDAWDLLGVNATVAAQPEIYGGVNMPAGYTASALVGVWRTNATGQLVIGVLDTDRRRVFCQRSTAFSAAASYPALTIASIANYVPKNAKTVVGDISGSTSGGSGQSMVLSIASDASGTAQIFPTGLQYVQVPYEIPMLTPQAAYFICTTVSGTPSIQINVNGYTF